MREHGLDRIFPYIFFSIVALVVVGWVTCAYFVAESYDKPCSYFVDTPAKYVPVRCYKEFGITPIVR